MAFEIPSFNFGIFQANVDMSVEVDGYSVSGDFQFQPMIAVPATGTGVYTSGAIAPVAADGDPILGLLQNNPQLAEAAVVMVAGVSKAIAYETIAVGQSLMAKAAPALSLGLAAVGKYQVAIALEPAVAGQVFSVLLLPHGKA